MKATNQETSHDINHVQPAMGHLTGHAAARCKRLSTSVLVTLVLLFTVAACGGSPKSGPYEKAVSKQEACCGQLADDYARSQCNDNIVRVDDSSAVNTNINRNTYRCVEKHFVCDGNTGTATQESSQSALDCISDLPQ